MYFISFVEISDTKQSISSEQSNLIVVREPPTSSSSSDSIFTDPASLQSPQYNKSKILPLKLTITNLEPFNFHPEPLVDLQICKNDSINVSSEQEDSEDLEDNEMPIVRNKMCSDSDNNLDKSIFNVSRVKKVELSEIPLNKTEMCSSKFKEFITLFMI